MINAEYQTVETLSLSDAASNNKQLEVRFGSGWRHDVAMVHVMTSCCSCRNESDATSRETADRVLVRAIRAVMNRRKSAVEEEEEEKTTSCGCQTETKGVTTNLLSRLKTRRDESSESLALRVNVV
ncbi:Hypothetical predicted protein [Scomber scombrus]|uniref:Uncharacterized protein n=1 Tax=Scomber scombrus TaxID=13677 RepID=A0AAV1Q2H1_SCOSC